MTVTWRELLRTHPSYLVLIEGHCDNRAPRVRRMCSTPILGSGRPKQQWSIWLLEPEQPITWSRASRSRSSSKKTAVFWTLAYRPVGTVIHRALTSVMPAVLSYRSNVRAVRRV